MMNITNTFFINIRKLKHHTGKALFLIVPIAVLMTLTVVVSSHAANIQTAATQSILGTAEQQSTVLQVEKQQERGGGAPGNPFEEMDQSYSNIDVEAIEAIDHVSSAQLAVTVPVENVYLEDLFADESLEVTSIVGLEDEMASLYTTSDFVYTEGEPIPVILNASTFTKTYEDWGDETEITVEMQFGRPGDQDDEEENAEEDETSPENQSPIKTEALAYNEDELMGKTITLSVKGFSDLATYTTDMSSDGIVFTKTSDSDLEEQEEEKQNAIAEYWVYDSLNTPITYELIVVGVIESDSDYNTYIPDQAAEILVSDYIQREIDARTEDVPESELNAIYNGLTYDGSELTSDLISQITRNSRFGAQGRAIMRDVVGGFGPGGQPSQEVDSVEVDFESTESYDVPGLVIETDPDTDDVVGQIDDSTIYADSYKTSTQIWVKIDDVSYRDDVVAALNTAGYSYQDFNDLEAFGSIDETIQTITLVLTVAFITLSVGVVVLTMSKFVSDSRKEIGIFRAMGVTKGGIRTLFISQATIYTVVGYAVGLIVGLVLTYLVSGFIYEWFQGLITSTLGEGFEVIQTVDASVFQQVSWEPLLVYSGLLAVITFVISLVPANQAAGISPVEAIKSE